MSEAPSPRQLFVTFLGIALSGFGGVLPFARRTLVERRGWIGADDFNETLALCQSLPGPNVVNLSIVVGARAAGWRGSVAAVTGLVAAPAVIVTALAMLYARFGGIAQTQGALAGLAAAAAGLVVATASRMAAPLLRRRWRLTAPFMLAAFAAVGVLQLPLPYVMAALAPASVALVWRRPG
ncbi:MAG TPA: chromate transporter [Caulobacteraceae bacterium]|nr:chromate transporter [Caulobacteraceae bacterium]